MMTMMMIMEMISNDFMAILFAKLFLFLFFNDSIHFSIISDYTCLDFKLIDSTFISIGTCCLDFTRD